MTKALSLEWSHGRLRTALRRPSDGGAPALPETVDTAPERDVKTGRFTAGNQAARRRAVKRVATGISTLNPAACAGWLRPHVADGASYAMQLLERFPDPALSRLVGATVDAFVVSRSLLTLGAQGDNLALKESRAWAAAHRAHLRELTSLAGAGLSQAPNPHEEHEAALIAEREGRS